MGCMLVDHEEPVAVLDDPVRPESAAENAAIRFCGDVEKPREGLLLIELLTFL